jgi:hypothetical protein
MPEWLLPVIFYILALGIIGALIAEFRKTLRGHPEDAAEDAAPPDNGHVAA